MRLLVVGATGSLGGLAVAEAAQRGHDVTALVRDPARANLPEPVVAVRGDVLDPVSLGLLSSAGTRSAARRAHPARARRAACWKTAPATSLRRWNAPACRGWSA